MHIYTYILQTLYICIYMLNIYVYIYIYTCAEHIGAGYICDEYTCANCFVVHTYGNAY